MTAVEGWANVGRRGLLTVKSFLIDDLGNTTVGDDDGNVAGEEAGEEANEESGEHCGEVTVDAAADESPDSDIEINNIIITTIINQ